MSKESQISMLLNEAWQNFVETTEEEQQLFTELLKSCQKDMRESKDYLPRELMTYKYYPPLVITVGWVQENDCVTAFYTINAEGDIIKRWPKKPPHHTKVEWRMMV